jgi:hypothetical protein
MATPLLLALAAGSSAATPWTEDAKLRAIADAKHSRPALHPPVYTLDLDAPAAHRWDHIAKDFKDKMPAVVKYFDSVIPSWALPLIEGVAARLNSYFSVYGEEMAGVAQALNVSKGLVVMLNLVMQLEAIGVNCSNWNETGPTRKDDPGCMAVDPSQKWCYCHAAHAAGDVRPDGIAEFSLRPRARNGERARDDEPGLCTSIVAQRADGHVVHGRNLDWNLPESVRAIMVDIDFVKGGKKLFRASGSPGVAGTLHGLSHAGGGWSVTIDARGKGGKLLVNMLQSLLVHSMTPTQHMRQVLEEATGYEDAVQRLSASPQIDMNYFIVAGAAPAEGAVITRGREKAVDVWRIDPKQPDGNGWYRLQTNYDHWNPAPVADDRRTPGVQMMNAVGRAGMSAQSMFGVINTWPVFNYHTDFSVVIVPSEGLYNSTVWMD